MNDVSWDEFHFERVTADPYGLFVILFEGHYVCCVLFLMTFNIHLRYRRFIFTSDSQV